MHRGLTVNQSLVVPVSSFQNSPIFSSWVYLDITSLYNFIHENRLFYSNKQRPPCSSSSRPRYWASQESLSQRPWPQTRWGRSATQPHGPHRPTSPSRGSLPALSLNYTRTSDLWMRTFSFRQG